MQDYDAIIVGSGLTGSCAAMELTAKGHRVLMLEAGPETTPADLDPAKRSDPPNQINLRERGWATLMGQHIQARSLFFSKALRHLFVNDRKHPYTRPEDAPYNWVRCRRGGGRAHVFGRVLMRWSDDDFRLKERTGKGVNWPISYTDVEPYYEAVEEAVGVYGNPDGVPTQPDSKFRGPAQLTPAEQAFKAEVEEKFEGRRVTSWRFMAPAPATDRVLPPMRRALDTGLLDVRFNAVARRLITSEDGKTVTGVELADGDTVKARSVVLCASTIESVRLLLNSADEAHPEGLANSSGTLGRYLMDQMSCTASGQYMPVKGSATDTSLPEDPFYGGTLNGFFMPRAHDAEGKATGLSAFQCGAGRKPVAEGAPAHMEFCGFGMMMPRAENRVTIDKTKHDVHGIPVAHVALRIGEEDKEVVNAAAETLTKLAEGTGASLDFIATPLGLKEMGRGAYPDLNPFLRFVFRRSYKKALCMGAAIHETGGARMGDDPMTSVLNRWNQSWDLPNLYVTDASAFPTSGVSGATLTAMALSVRACRHLSAQLNGEDMQEDQAAA